TVKVFKNDPATWSKSWTYQLRTQKNAGTADTIQGPLTSAGVASEVAVTRGASTVMTEQPKRFTKTTSVSVDPGKYETSLRVYPNTTQIENTGSELLLKRGPEEHFKNKAVLADTNGKLSFVDLDIALAPTHKVPVEKEVKGPLWTITAKEVASGPNNGFVYGEVKIKKDTSFGKDLVVPTNKDFILYVKGPGLSAASQFLFSGDNVNRLQKITIDKGGKIVPVLK
ncbi:MAG: hypothetical protein IT346_03035, partial [Epsilonproteobacteria bacterium]|nr:hypothetical protein [Campylobacterota bacterium]